MDYLHLWTDVTRMYNLYTYCVSRMFVFDVDLMMMMKTNRFLHESLLKIWDFFHECEKFRLFTSGAQRNEWKDTEFLSRVEEIPDLQ